MNPFTYSYPTKAYFGENAAANNLAAELAEVGTNVMLAYGGGSIKKNGIYDELLGVLKDAGKTVTEFAGIMSNPTYAKVQEGAVLAKEKNIVIHQQISRDTVLTVDKDLWSKALSNIIGNAVRHSPEGEQVFIALETVDDKQALVVTNTGASIPEEDMPHLFTPFYRADRSRSRATGGSGLGLYIVKTILELHDMSCSIKNTENGVAFYVFV